jgi:hypothetical protein
LPANEYVRVIVNPEHLDLTVKAINPAGTQLVALESAYREQGPVEVVFISKEPTSFQLQVHSTEDNELESRYTLQIAEERAATEQDEVRVRAQQLFSEAQQTHDRGTSDSRRLAFDQFHRALLLWREAKDDRWRALTLDQIGVLGHEMGDNRQALEALQ